MWPIKSPKCLTRFTHDADLIKMRLHVGDRDRHVPVCISKDKSSGYGLGNKYGWLTCTLCYGRTSSRTYWMCPTCVVPLCVDVDVLDSDPYTSCHTLWHRCRDLVVLNKSLYSKKKPPCSQESEVITSVPSSSPWLSEAIACVPSTMAMKKGTGNVMLQKLRWNVMFQKLVIYRQQVCLLIICVFSFFSLILTLIFDMIRIIIVVYHIFIMSVFL
jgi:hypothetical protein